MKQSINIPSSKSIPIEGPWDVRFPHGWGAPVLNTFDTLHSWTDSPIEGIQSFSGIATYRKDFSFNMSNINTNMLVYLDLGEVREIARVYLNGEELGISSFAPHRFDVTNVVRDGVNYLVIEIANTWLNRMIADDNLPNPQRLTHSNIANGPTSETGWKDAQPKASGLLGPVRLESMQRMNIVIH